MGRALGIDTAVSALPTSINGLTHTFRPGIQWFGNAQQRLGFNTAYDAVEGFDRYIEGVADVITQTDNIQRLRALASQIRYRTGDEGIREQVDRVRENSAMTEDEKQAVISGIYEKGRYTLSNFVVELEEYTNLLANKKSRADRNMEQALGRRMYNVMKGLEGRVAANMVAVNPASWLTNFVPITQGWGSLDTRSLLGGMWDTLRAYRSPDAVADRSTFLTNRRGSDPIVKTWKQELSGKLSAPMEYIDQFTAGTLVRGRYSQNLRRGMSEEAAIEDADAWTASLMADRSKGSMPNVFHQSNPMAKVLTQFQLEVNNQLSYVFKDLPDEMKEKGLGALVGALFKFFLGAYLYNEVYEHFIGRRPALDPIGILEETGEEWRKDGAYAALSGTAENVAEELPFIGGLLGGGRVPISSAIPDVGQLSLAALDDEWSKEKRLRTAGKELTKPATYLVLPFGGGQFKKIFEAVDAVRRGGSYTVDNEGNDILQYPVFTDTVGQAAGNLLAAATFGKTSLPAGQEWVAQGFKNLSADATAAYQGMIDAGAKGEDAYPLIQELSTAQAERDADGKVVRSRADVQGELLCKSVVPNESKTVAYYTLAASDKERETLGILADMDADLWSAVQAIIGMKTADKQAEKLEALTKHTGNLTDQEVMVLAGLVLGTERLTESGEETKYTKLLEIVDAGLNAEDAVQLIADGVDPNNYLKLTQSGVGEKAAVQMSKTLAGLKPEDGRDTVSSLQRFRAVADSELSEKERRNVVRSMLEESALEKFEAVTAAGITVGQWVDYKEAAENVTADKGLDGKTVSGSKKAKVLRIIDEMDLTAAQKTALYRDAGYSDNTLDDAPWYSGGLSLPSLG